MSSQIIHVTSWLSRQGGGIPPVIWSLAREIHLRGLTCAVAGLNDPWVAEDCAGNGLPLLTGKITGPSSFGYSPELSARLQAQVRAGDIVHSHGLWMYPGLAARQIAKKKRAPLVVSPHGMLEPWALKNSRWKKKLVGHWFENKNLHSAECLHALCAAEAENFRSYGLKNPIAIIPNGIDLASLDVLAEVNALVEKFPAIKGRRRVLFLSRLHPKKGLNNLLRAWRQLSPDFKDWCLMIAGGGQPDYETELKTLAKESGLENSVVFLGPVYGEVKKQALAAADVFILPSFSEGFSVAILEAAGAGLPVLLTRECNFPELAKAGAAFEIAPTESSIGDGLRQILQLSSDQRKSMGQQGRQLMKQSYTWPAIAGQMCQVYAWLEGKAAMPGFVVND